MIFDLELVMQAAINDLKPFHQELIWYILSLPGKRRPTYIHAKKTWNLTKERFNVELQSAFSSLRDSLRRRGIFKSADLDMR
jgi:hypothetical protein